MPSQELLERGASKVSNCAGVFTLCSCCFSWGRWKDILTHGRFKWHLNEKDMEMICRALLVYCVKHYKGDDKIKSFIWDLITPTKDGQNQALQNHSGIACSLCHCICTCCPVPACGTVAAEFKAEPMETVCKCLCFSTAISVLKKGLPWS